MGKGGRGEQERNGKTGSGVEKDRREAQEARTMNGNLQLLGFGGRGEPLGSPRAHREAPRSQCWCPLTIREIEPGDGTSCSQAGPPGEE